MGSVADIDDYVNKLTGGAGGAPESIFWFKQDYIAGVNTTAMVGGKMQSAWRFSGYPGAGVAPTTVAAPTNATAGALCQTDPAGGSQKFVLGGHVATTSDCVFILYDRLLHIGSLDATVITPQTVAGALTRYTTGAASIGNQLFYEIYTQIGATGTTISCSYTNQSGTSGRTTSSMTFGGTGFREANLMLPFQLQSGDTGVQAVASTTVLASTTTAGSFGITVARPLAIFGTRGLAGTMAAAFDLVQRGVAPEVITGACIALMFGGAGATIPRMMGGLNFLEAA